MPKEEGDGAAAPRETEMADVGKGSATVAPDTAAADADLTTAARSAFARNDIEASKLVHEMKAAGHSVNEEWHGGLGSDRIRSITLGGLDGIITTFAIIAAVSGASLSIEVILLVGVSNVLADAVSMGLGDYLSTSSEADFIMQERKREAWETKHNLEGEKAEMIEIYIKKGFAKEDAETLINTLTKKEEYLEAFVDLMMIDELGLQVPDPDDNPALDGLVTFVSFILFGSVPLLLYLIFYFTGYSDPAGTFGIACAVVALTMFLLGAVKASITKQNPFVQGGLMMLNGSLAAAAAYLVGWGLEEALGASGSN